MLNYTDGGVRSSLQCSVGVYNLNLKNITFTPKTYIEGGKQKSQPGEGNIQW